MKRIMLVMGTRPEAIKLCPLVRELRRRGRFCTVVCATGQHRAMLDPVMAEFGIRPDIDLNVMRQGQTVSEVTSRILIGMDAVLRENRPELVLVQGDTATAYAASLAAFYQRIPVGHIEAGLRTYRLHAPFPEEYHRQTISKLADFHFAPTAAAKKNLLREGKSERCVFLTGNTVIDALQYSLRQPPKGSALELPPKARILLFTAHRRESLGEPLQGMMRALRRLVEEHPDAVAVCPLHYHPKVRAAAEELLQGHERILLIEPPQMIAFHQLLAVSYLVLTDSGGIQEEATALGIPTLVMRYATERSEGIRAGVLKLCGSGEEGILHAARELLREDSEAYAAMHKPADVFGDGRASVRISAALERIMK